MRVEPQINIIQPALQPLEFVYNNSSGPYTTKLYGTRYYFTFLYDATKRSKVFLLKEKGGCFFLFKDVIWKTKRATTEFDSSRQTITVNLTPRLFLNFEKKKILYGSQSSTVTLKWIAKQKALAGHYIVWPIHFSKILVLLYNIGRKLS